MATRQFGRDPRAVSGHAVGTQPGSGQRFGKSRRRLFTRQWPGSGGERPPIAGLRLPDGSGHHPVIKPIQNGRQFPIDRRSQSGQSPFRRPINAERRQMAPPDIRTASPVLHIALVGIADIRPSIRNRQQHDEYTMARKIYRIFLENYR
jgi:hypothetical protein